VVSLKQNWLPIDKGIEICEISYQAEGWDQPRRMIICIVLKKVYTLSGEIRVQIYTLDLILK